ncbi:MAG TPA: amino acid racemase [Steroidobacteraceae bacterium]|nr:amino acid racemase [Steroidobacteraceae bacterium]
MLVSAIQPRAASAGQKMPAADMKMLGLIGGTSWHSTVEYYRYINQAVNDYYGNNTNPPLMVYDLNQRQIHDLQLQDEWDKIADIYSGAAITLRQAGAQAVLFAANTPYKIYPEVARRIGIPILHIADATGMAIQRAHLERVGLIGTRYTMEDGFIPRYLKEHYGLEVLVPSARPIRAELHRIIQQELGMGIIKLSSKQYVLEQIAELRKRGAQGIILGCTEFTLIISQTDVQIPAFDTTRLHAQMAVDFILGRYLPACDACRPSIPTPRAATSPEPRR